MSIPKGLAIFTAGVAIGGTAMYFYMKKWGLPVYEEVEIEEITPDYEPDEEEPTPEIIDKEKEARKQMRRDRKALGKKITDATASDDNFNPYVSGTEDSDMKLSKAIHGDDSDSVIQTEHIDYTAPSEAKKPHNVFEEHGVDNDEEDMSLFKDEEYLHDTDPFEISEGEYNDNEEGEWVELHLFDDGTLTQDDDKSIVLPSDSISKKLYDEVMDRIYNNSWAEGEIYIRVPNDNIDYAIYRVEGSSPLHTDFMEAIRGIK